MSEYDNLRRLGGCKPRSAIERFEASYIPEPNSGCWLWVGTLRGSNLYGTLKVDGKPMAAHRFSYSIAKGEIPSGMVICHHCDMPSCVNPNHLFLGTHADNEADKARKGRQSKGEKHREALKHLNRKGEMSPVAKLNWEKVKQIRSSGKSQREIAKEYGVSQALVSRIKLEKTWRLENG